MDREYLEDYKRRELKEIEKLENKIIEGKFSFSEDEYPPTERFVKLREPVALASASASNLSDIWAQLPFSGSLIIIIPPRSKAEFEEEYFKASEIPEIIDFIQKTGKLQVVIGKDPLLYEGLDYLEPFFTKLKPPLFAGAPFSVFGTEKEIESADHTFHTLAKSRYSGFLDRLSLMFGSRTASIVANKNLNTYIALKLGHYAIAEEIENLMIDDPEIAFMLLVVCHQFITDPLMDIRSNLRNFTLRDIKQAQILPHVYQPKDLRFPCEIGKFLLKKLTYAPQGTDACKELMYRYDAYDLQRVQESLNEAIVTNHPDIVNKSAEELSEILDNVWNDPEIPKLVKNLRRGVPMSIAAIGAGVSAFTGGLEGFLAGLGFSVGAKFLDVEIEGLSARIAKWLTRSYQANVYDFKKKYKNRIVQP